MNYPLPQAGEPGNPQSGCSQKQSINPAIIGGGYAGMAAAVALAERGISVTVYESAKQLGGRARGVSVNGMQLDNGQHLLLGCYHQTLQLIEQVGGSLEQDFLRLPLQLDLQGKFSLHAPCLPAPLHLLGALLGSKGLTFGLRLKAASFIFTLRRMNFILFEDMTVAELLARHNQCADLTQKLWEPLCIATLNTPIHKASAQILLNVLRDALNQKRRDSDMLLPRIDLSALFPDRATDYIERRGGRVHTSCGVDKIIPRNDGFELISANGANIHSHVICAAPPWVAAGLLRPIGNLENLTSQIEALQHQPIYTLYLRYPEQVRLPHPILGLYRRISQWLFDKGRITGQHGLIAAVISAEGIHQELPQKLLAQRVIAELCEEFGIHEQPVWFKVIAEKRATFACAPNLQRPQQQTSIRGLLLAGDYIAGDYPATLEGAVRSGLRCAELIF